MANRNGNGNGNDYGSQVYAGPGIGSRGVAQAPYPIEQGGGLWQNEAAAFFAGGRTDWRRRVGDLWNTSVVACGLRWKLDNFPEPPLQVKRWIRVKNPNASASSSSSEAGDGDAPAKTKRDLKEVRNHPLVKLVERPNPAYNGDVLLGATAVSLDLSGDAYWFVNENGYGEPCELWWLPHFDVAPYWEGDDFITGYEIWDGRTIKRWAPKWIIHFRRGLNPRNPRKGYSALDQQLREVATDEEISSMNAGLAMNLGLPSFMVSGDDETGLGDESIQTIRQAFGSGAYSGERAGRILAMKKRAKFTRISYSPDELCAEKIRDVPEARICSALGIHPLVLALSVSARQRTYNNQEQAEKQSQQNGLIPLQKLVACQLETTLLPRLSNRWRDEQVGWDYSQVEALQEKQESKVKRGVSVFVGGLARRNEARAIAGLDPDPTPAGDEYRQAAAPVPPDGKDKAKAKPGADADGDSGDKPKKASQRRRERKQQAMKGNERDSATTPTLEHSGALS